MKGIPSKYVNDGTPAHAIYPSSKQSWFFTLLIISKILRCTGIFLAYNLLHRLNAPTLVFSLKLISTCFLLLIQKPFSSNPKLTQSQWLHIGQFSFVRALVTLVMFYGLTLCGPFRTILLLEQHDFVVITVLGSLFTGVKSPATFRGTLCFIAAIMSLIILDNDEESNSNDSHFLSDLTSGLGLSDHKLVVLLLTCLLLVKVGLNVFAKRVASDVGGQRRFHSLSSFIETGLLFPCLIVSLFFQQSDVNLINVIQALVASLFIFVIPYYAESACAQRFEVHINTRIGSISVCVCALILAIIWNQPYSTQDEKHHLSGGGMFAWTLFLLAGLSVTSLGKQGTKGSFVGYSTTGLPLYNFTNGAFHNTSRSIILMASSVLKQILDDNNSRRIFYFLCLNLCFTFVEFLYGIWTNSLGLISDGFHMLFDCSALVMGLLASVMARWKPSKTFSYGYSRIEDISGFVNGLFLLVISFYVFSEAISRLFDPPTISTQRLLVVSICGLGVNLVGILVFRHGTSHGHSHHHGHSHGPKPLVPAHGHSHNSNMEGVFLHIMADTLGSVGVIVSSLLIEQFGWYIADPVCSIFIAGLIFASVTPLLKNSAFVLLLRTPQAAHNQINSALEEVRSVEGVLNIRKYHFWQHSSDTFVGTIHVHASSEANEQNIIQQVSSIFKKTGIHQCCIQLEKEDFFAHLAGLSSQLKNHSYDLIGHKDPLFLVKAV